MESEAQTVLTGQAFNEPMAVIERTTEPIPPNPESAAFNVGEDR
jgi:hypothetical protein